MTACRFCEAPLDLTLVDLGETPLANSYLPQTDEAIAAERRYRLCAKVCTSCWLVQLDYDADAEIIFDENYAYLSSFSDSWVAHAKRYANAMTERFGLGPDSLAMEIASNDGYLLQHFVADEIPVLGVEPAGYAASLAEKRGVPSRVMFFNAEMARGLADEGVSADIIAANNVLAHVPDIRGFVAGFPIVLKPEGVVTFEFPSLANLLRELQFDTIYHEHYSYLSLTAVERILKSAGLRVFDLEELPTHGGSLRVYACHDDASHRGTDRLAAARMEEDEFGIASRAAYEDFAARVDQRRDAFLAFLAEAKSEGLTVGAYGAAAKGNTFLNYCGVGPDEIFAVADRNDQKQDTLLPGTHIPVISPDEMLARKPDRLVILPWNLRAEIAQQMQAIRAHGGRFVVPGATASGEIEIF